MSENQPNPNLFLVDHRRSERRTAVSVPIEVIQSDKGGHEHIERTYIEDVSDFGCRFSTRGVVQKGETVTVKLLGLDGKDLPDEGPRLYEIMWVAPKPRGTTVGARLLKGEKMSSDKVPVGNGEEKSDPK